MAYSYFDYEGTDTTIQTDILCVSTEHMYAFKVLSEEKSKVTLSGVPLSATFTKTNAGVLCELDTAPSTKIRVIRSTPYDVLMHDFSNGAQFNADSVDEVYEQLLYLCQETVEGKLIMDSSGNFSGTIGVGLTDVATKTDVSNAVTAVKNEILGGAGAAFDTLKELAAALGNDANFARTIADELAKKADKATTLAAYGLGDAIAVLTGTIADGGTIPLPAGFSEAQCKFMVSTSRDNPADIPWDIDESGRHVHYGYECTLNGRVVSCKAWLNKNRTTMGNAHPEITVPGRANYLVIAYK